MGDVCADKIKPPTFHEAHRVATPDGEGGVLVVVLPAGPTVHRSPGGCYRREGHAKRRIAPEEERRLLLARGLSDDTAADAQPVGGTGVHSLQPALWRRYASSRADEAATIQLAKLKFVKEDAAGATRATIGGVLLAAEDPREWLPNAYVQAVRYGGTKVDGNRQLDARTSPALSTRRSKVPSGSSCAIAASPPARTRLAARCRSTANAPSSRRW